ncbi:MAG: hypothetical protein ACRBBK_08225 [Paracoccaceae bacterium]
MKSTVFKALAACLLLTACSAPALTLMSRSTGQMGTGAIEKGTLAKAGGLTIAFKNETYQGQWLPVRNPGAFDFGLIDLGKPTRGNFGAISQSDSGFGTALLRSNKGSSMRCEFNYNAMSNSAVGICEKNGTGEVFDLQAN